VRMQKGSAGVLALLLVLLRTSQMDERANGVGVCWEVLFWIWGVRWGGIEGGTGRPLLSCIQCWGIIFLWDRTWTVTLT
jgi:hypothetical protein